MGFPDSLGAPSRHRSDPPHKHWLSPFPDIHGAEFCGHCGDDWPCPGYRRAVCITCGETLTVRNGGLSQLYCDQDNPAGSYYP